MNTVHVFVLTNNALWLYFSAAIILFVLECIVDVMFLTLMSYHVCRSRGLSFQKVISPFQRAGACYLKSLGFPHFI